jgi:hypothetical protein
MRFRLTNTRLLRRRALVLVAATLGLCTRSADAQRPGDRAGSITGAVYGDSTRAAVVGAEVRVQEQLALTDSLGRFRFADVAAGRQRLSVFAPGFRPYEIIVRVPRAGVLRVEVELDRRVHRLSEIDVQDTLQARSEKERALELYHRFGIPGTSTVSRASIASMPIPIAPDVMRALQSLPGMTPANELDAQLYVRGGAGDQNLFLLDGAPVYGAYHAFGMAGAFNPAAIERVDLFRAVRPARYGGALSSVLELEDRGGGGPRETEAGVSVVDGRVSQRGTLANDVGYMLAARQTFARAVDPAHLPFAFGDVHAVVSNADTARHQLRVSAFASTDAFDLFFGDAEGDLRSSWSNAVVAAQWRCRLGAWTGSTNVWRSEYRARLDAGPTDSSTSTRNRLSATGARAEVSRGVPGSLLRAGVDATVHEARLTGTETSGSYFSGVASDRLIQPSAYLEGEALLGTLRLSPGVRVTRDARRSAWLAEPRLGLRIPLSEATALTVGAGRDHQLVSGLRDERTTLPGPPFWFVHPLGTPASGSDHLSVDVTTWPRGREWSVSVGAYTRTFTDVPHWRPAGTRDLSTLSFDDGRSEGFELLYRRYGEALSGSLSYTLARTRFTDARSGASYDAVTDRRHVLDANVAAHLRAGVFASARVSAASGAAFWPFAGETRAPRITPVSGWIEIDLLRRVPSWSTEQLHMPTHARVDLGLRRRFRVGPTAIEPYLVVQNVIARRNVIYYRAETIYERDANENAVPTGLVLRPVSLPFTVIPSIGADIRF